MMNDFGYLKIKVTLRLKVDTDYFKGRKILQMLVSGSEYGS